MLMPEVLKGDNQFFCDNCGRKCDASRRQLLRRVPPYLCLALQRFYFNYQVRRAAPAPVRLRSCAAQHAWTHPTHALWCCPRHLPRIWPACMSTWHLPPARLKADRSTVLCSNRPCGLLPASSAALARAGAYASW